MENRVQDHRALRLNVRVLSRGTRESAAEGGTSRVAEAKGRPEIRFGEVASSKTGVQPGELPLRLRSGERAPGRGQPWRGPRTGTRGPRPSPVPAWICAVWLGIVSGAGCGSGPGGEESFRDPSKLGVSFTVMTYNILVDLPNAEYEPWGTRQAFVAGIIRSHDPDLIGLQEPFAQQVQDVLQLCPGYRAVTLEAPLDFYTDAVILFRAARFEKISQGSFWLSPTPDVPLSGGLGLGFGNFLPRVVIWALMRDLDNGVEFYFVDTHFDNTPPSQEKSAPLFLERIGPLAAQAPLIAVGDFNSRPGSPAYRTLTEGAPGKNGEPFRLLDSFHLAPGFTVSAREGDVTDYDTSSRIDHVLAAGGTFTCPGWTVDMTSYGEERRYPSDHFAVVARVRLIPGG